MLLAFASAFFMPSSKSYLFINCIFCSLPPNLQPTNQLSAYQSCLLPTLVLLHGRPPALNGVALQDCALFAALLCELLRSLVHLLGIFALAAASRALRLIAWPPSLRVLQPHRLMVVSTRLVPTKSFLLHPLSLRERSNALILWPPSSGPLHLRQSLAWSKSLLPSLQATPSWRLSNYSSHPCLWLDRP